MSDQQLPDDDGDLDLEDLGVDDLDADDEDSELETDDDADSPGEEPYDDETDLHDLA